MSTHAESLTPRAAVGLLEDARGISRRVREAHIVALALPDGADVAGVLAETQPQVQRLIARLSEIVGIASPSVPTVPPIPLDQLDTPDTRELLATLEKAQQIAERIDAQRGRTVGDTIPLQPGESAGTDLAESVSLLALRVRQEVHGVRSPHE